VWFPDGLKVEVGDHGSCVPLGGPALGVGRAIGEGC
jgi:hypothetical protein